MAQVHCSCESIWSRLRLSSCGSQYPSVLNWPDTQLSGYWALRLDSDLRWLWVHSRPPDKHSCHRTSDFSCRSLESLANYSKPIEYCWNKLLLLNWIMLNKMAKIKKICYTRPEVGWCVLGKDTNEKLITQIFCIQRKVQKNLNFTMIKN